MGAEWHEPPKPQSRSEVAHYAGYKRVTTRNVLDTHADPIPEEDDYPGVDMSSEGFPMFGYVISQLVKNGNTLVDDIAAAAKTSTAMKARVRGLKDILQVLGDINSERDSQMLSWQFISGVVPVTWLHLEVRRSEYNLNGVDGCFATVLIPANSFIGVYRGSILNKEAHAVVEGMQESLSRSYVVHYGDEPPQFVDAGASYNLCPLRTIVQATSKEDVNCYYATFSRFESATEIWEGFAD